MAAFICCAPRLAALLLDGDLEEYPPLTVASILLPSWPQRHNVKGASSTVSTVCLGVMAPRQQPAVPSPVPVRWKCLCCLPKTLEGHPHRCSFRHFHKPPDRLERFDKILKVSEVGQDPQGKRMEKEEIRQC
ncbi:uncharacterized protein [Triticum aestivum]|uniref:uncharacterized protein isoform X2 n=1 Tax=Triticum aestivum TaxID=4565 RepID=UPI001D01A3B9|nr:uncharacterized protein LOC123063575 isoform X2 [Triticum aestivum]